ncbi:MAG: VanZ family protein [Vulcanimicrobiota bacterium]
MKKPKINRIIFWVYLIIITAVSLYPLSEHPLTRNDKLNHIIAYLVFAVLFYLAFGENNWKVIIWGAVYGLGIEIMQGFFPFRTFDPYDLLSNMAGILAGMGIIQLYLRVKKE